MSDTDEREALLTELFGDSIPGAAIALVHGDFTALPLDQLRERMTSFILKDYKRLLVQCEDAYQDGRAEASERE